MIYLRSFETRMKPKAQPKRGMPAVKELSRERPSQGFRVTRMTIRDQTYTQLRDAITSGYLKAGQRLIERDLCELVGASRTSVREALRLLEAEKLITVETHRGPMVATIDPEEAAKIYEVRAVLEGLVGRLFTTNASPNDIAELAADVIAFESAVTRADLPAMVDSTDQFYSTLFRGAGNEVVRDLLMTLHARISMLRAQSMSVPGRTPNSAKELRTIYEAAARRDIGGTEAACVLHVRHASAALQASHITTPAADDHRPEQPAAVRKESRRSPARGKRRLRA